MYKVSENNRFKKDLKRLIKQGKRIKKLDDVIAILEKGEKLDAKHRDHELKGDFATYRECHIEPNWLLVYKYHNDVLILVLSRTGSHSEIFGM